MNMADWKYLREARGLQKRTETLQSQKTASSKKMASSVWRNLGPDVSLFVILGTRVENQKGIEGERMGER